MSLRAGEKLLIFGASARAAAFSALRAGLEPWCADLFADADLQARCPTMRLPPGTYPQGFLELARGELPGPWMYTGGLENHGRLVSQMARLRPLWGNEGDALLARLPWVVAEELRAAGLPHPAVRVSPDEVPRTGRWLIKPLASAGGSGIRFWAGPPARRPRRPVYFQEYVDGEPRAAVYLGDDRGARLLGVTRQLVGEPWLHASPFRYCGSIGPLDTPAPLRQALERLGNVLASWFRLRGLFGVDFILRDGVPWPVEVNPRYTASVEVLEYAAAVPALALHRQVFDPAAPPVPRVPKPAGSAVLGKAVLFARQALTFPADGPWTDVLRAPGPLVAAPAFADIPPAGERIAAGRPVLTFFARGDTPAACGDELRRTAADLDRRLFSP
jgi:uncharacterized protein